MEVFLWALDFLTMMLRVGKNGKRTKKKTKKTKGRLHQTGLERNHNKKSIYMMHELNEQMMHALMH